MPSEAKPPGSDGQPLSAAVEQLADRLPREVYVYDLDGQQVYVRDAEHGVEVYERAGTTDDRDDLAAHDGPVIIGGRFRRVEETEYGTLATYHPHGGRMGWLDEDDPDDPAVLLAEVERRV